MLEIADMSVTYGRHRALRGVSVTVRPAEIVTILGANGAGKSSLLNAIAGLVEKGPDSRVRLDDRDLSRLPPYEIVEQGIALVPEGRGIFNDLTVRENLALGAFAKRARAHEKQHIDEVMDLFPRLQERLGQVVGTMSGGERQMVAIGRALMSNPTVLMLDEPSLGLSPVLTAELFKALPKIRDRQRSVLLVEQNVKRSLEISDRAYLLENAQIVGEGRASDLLQQDNIRAAYLGQEEVHGT